jgi:hypothetical protein
MSAPASAYRAARSSAPSRPLHGERVGPRHEHDVGIGPGVDRGRDAVDHLGGPHQLLARPVTAPLGLHLILQMQAGRAGADHLGGRPVDRQRRRAEPRVGVDQQRQLRRPVTRRTSSSTSCSVVIPRSGSPSDAFATPAPDTYSALEPTCSAMMAA